MKRRIAIFVSSGEPACIEHAIMKTTELYGNGDEVIMVIDGPAVASMVGYAQEGKACSNGYNELRRGGLIAAVCKDCAEKYRVLNEVVKQGLPLVKGHPDPNSYRERGFDVRSLVPKACNYCETWDEITSL